MLTINRTVSGSKLIYNVTWHEFNLWLANALVESLPNNIYRAIVEQGYSAQFAQSVVNSLKIDATPNSIMIQVDSPITFIEAGTKPRVMKNLVGKIVPIETPYGTVFRKVTSKSILRGGWRHPGTPAKNIIRKTIVSTINELIQYQRVVMGQHPEVVEWISKALLNLFPSMKSS